MQFKSIKFWWMWPFNHNYAMYSTDIISKMVGGNTGNLVFAYAIQRHVNKCDGLYHLDKNDEYPENIMPIFPAANQLNPSEDMGFMAERVVLSNRPTVAIGLGAQSETTKIIPNIRRGTLEWVKSIIEHAPNPGYPNISVRGRFTQLVLEHYGFKGSSVVLGCPSLFINPDQHLGRTISKKIRLNMRVAVCAGHTGWHKLTNIERSLIQLVKETHGAYIFQHPTWTMGIGRYKDINQYESEIKALQRYALPNLSYEETIDWLKKYGTIFFDVDAWMEFLHHFDFCIGGRIHGVMLALQAGIPAICIVHDSRLHELCETLAIPYIMASEVSSGSFTINDLRDMFKFDGELFDENRKRLAIKYVDFLQKNYMQPNPMLIKLARS